MMNLLLIVVSCWQSSARDLDLVFENNRAVNKFTQERYLESYEDLVAILGTSPADLVVQFNLAVAFEANKEPNKAEKMYGQIIKETESLSSEDPKVQEKAQLRFSSLYNLATLFAKLKNVPDALQTYQKALELVPESKEIKTNIELLLNGQGQGKGKGDGESDNSDENSEGDQDKDNKDKENDKDRRNQRTQQEEKKAEEQRKKQQQMSMQDLKHILEELKQQEGKIRAKIQGKGNKKKSKEGPGGKQW